MSDNIIAAILIVMLAYIGYLHTALLIERKLTTALQALNHELKRLSDQQLADIETLKKRAQKSAELIREMQEFHLN